MLRNICFVILFSTFFHASKAQVSLQDYINTAKQNSPILFDNKNQALINELEVQRLKSFYTKPQIGLTANYLIAPIVSTNNGNTAVELNSNGATNYFGYDLASSNGGVYQGLITYTQPLFNGARYDAYSNQSTINAQINQNNIALTEHDIEKIVTDQYILCLLDEQQMIFADSVLILLDEQIAIVKKLVESSIMKQSDLSLLNIEYQYNRGLRTTYDATYKRDLMDLKILCGITDTAFVWIGSVELELSDTLFASNYQNKYKYDSLSVMATQNIFETKYMPQLNFYCNGGLNAVYAPTIPNRFGVSAGLSFTWNILDGGQKSLTREKTTLQLQTISNNENYFLQQNSLRKTKILAELESYNDRKAIAETQIQEYNTLLDLYKKEILQGQLSILSYVTAIKNMTLIKRDYLILETNRLLLINAYNYWNW